MKKYRSGEITFQFNILTILILRKLNLSTEIYSVGIWETTIIQKVFVVQQTVRARYESKYIFIDSEIKIEQVFKNTRIYCIEMV